VTEPSHAVFLSYASEDVQAARRIAEALRAAGIEVWFDQSELRGGDAWDRAIREQIHDCRLFIPIISDNSEHRDEGYFRREWSLAVDRTRDMAHKRAFLVPVVIDGTTERGASVPEKFLELQWTRLPGGETSPAFVERVQRLLAPEALVNPGKPAANAAQPGSPGAAHEPLGGPWSAKRVGLFACALAGLGVAGYFIIAKPWLPKASVSRAALTANAPSTAFAPPPHSIAVLPFVNMSGDQKQEYFSEGLTEELLNSLSQISNLQVAARTSSFSFEKHPDIGTVARKLNVAAVLEGSVRRSANTVRVTAQLINTVTGFHLWSKTYDRDLGDVLKLQTEIATAVAETLKVTLLGDVAARIELGGTRNPAAFDAYLRASKGFNNYERASDLQAVIAGYSEAIHQDPGYALAFADRSVAFAAFARNYATGKAVQEYYAKAQADAQGAIALAPDLAEAHLSLANLLRDSLEFTRASEEYQRAIALAPGNARVSADYGVFASEMGQIETGLAAVRHALVLDPLSSEAYSALGSALMAAHRYPEAAQALEEAKRLAGNSGFINAWLSFTYYAAGDYQSARLSCEGADDSNKDICFALVYQKLGRHSDAKESMAQLRAKFADNAAVFYAMIYGQWGDKAEALKWLDVAMRQRDPYLIKLRMNGLFDPLRNEPRYQAVERELKFPT
jgi:TolB-like protein/tetratricopeptide (TPR) repeat protein